MHSRWNDADARQHTTPLALRIYTSRLLGADQAQGMLDEQRQRLQAQIDGDLDNTLLYVYRQLSDAELEEFVSFAQSPAGRDYYRAALAAVKAALQGPVQSAGL